MAGNFTLRRLLPGDGPAMERLERQTPDTGALGFYTEYHHDLYETRMALQPRLMGAVAEAPNYDGLVGMALVTFGECMVEDEQRPYAYLTGLSVHPDFRRRGIATALATWRLEMARSRFGDEGVIFAGIQGGNVGSLRTAEKWSNAVLNSASYPGRSGQPLDRRSHPLTRDGSVMLDNMGSTWSEARDTRSS